MSEKLGHIQYQHVLIIIASNDLLFSLVGIVSLLYYCYSSNRVLHITKCFSHHTEIFSVANDTGNLNCRCGAHVASLPGPRPAFYRLHAVRDGKLSEGLGTRLVHMHYCVDGLDLLVVGWWCSINIPSHTCLCKSFSLHLVSLLAWQEKRTASTFWQR